MNNLTSSTFSILKSAAIPLCLSLATLVMAQSAVAGSKTCYVDKIKYTNKGAYTVRDLEFRYINNYGDKSYVDSDQWGDLQQGDNNDITKGQSITINLDNYNGKTPYGDGDYRKGFKDGQEVWIKANITAGESKSCRKDGHKLVYKKGVNKTMTFKTSGTTLNNNRCKYNGDMGNDCYTGD